MTDSNGYTIHDKSKKRSFFYRSKGDSPFKRILIHLILVLACVIAVYPVLRILSVSLRPGDRLLSTSLAIIPKDASLGNYREVLFDKKNKHYVAGVDGKYYDITGMVFPRKANLVVDE